VSFFYTDKKKDSAFDEKLFIINVINDIV